MLARRLLIVGGGSSFTPPAQPPAPPEVFTLTSSPEGAWPGGLGGHPFHYNGTSYVGYADDTGLIRVAAFDHATGNVTLTTVGGPTSVDQHNRPAVIRRSSDGRLVTVLCNHNSADIYSRISTSPDDSTAWDSATNIDSQLGATLYTYPWLCQLGDETDDPIYLFYRDNDGLSNWEISTSTDGGETWSSFTNLVYAVRAYARAFKSSESRIDFVVTDGSYAEDYASVYHFYYDGTYRTSDGSAIAGSPPFAFGSLTKIYDGATAGARYPASHARVGSEIAVLIPVQTGTPASHIGEDGDYIYARWNGSAWSTHTLAADVGATTFEFTEGAMAVDPSDINRVAISVRVSGQWQIKLGTTSDAGASWSFTTLTDTVEANMYPEFLLAHDAELEFVWLRGTFTTQSSFATGIEGYGMPV